MEYEDSTCRLRIQDLNQRALPNPWNRMVGTADRHGKLEPGHQRKMQD
jgi:hypothetical protein